MIVLNFHRVEKPTGLEITRLSPSRFECVLDEIEHACAPMRDGLQREFLMTFDDGYASICEHALPRLRERGLGAIVFLITLAIGSDDRWDTRILGRNRPMMTWDQVRDWSRAGFTFGSHTCTHCDLTALSPRRLRTELSDSRARIEDEIGKAVSYLSYPYGRHSDHVRDAAREVGYEMAFAVSGIPGDQFAIPRVNVHALMTTLELRNILAGGNPSWRTRLFTSLSAGSATVGNWKRTPRMQRSYKMQRSPKHCDPQGSSPSPSQDHCLVDPETL